MNEPHFLRAGNARRIKRNLQGVVDASALDAIESCLCENVRQLFELARQHLSLATKLTATHWRHSVSRAYYAAYSAARAVRLYTTGEYSTDVKDHQRFDQLPDDFPQRERFANQLSVLRDDRNLSDYDHSATAEELVLGRSDSIALAREFLDEAKGYFSSKGLRL